MKYRYNGNLNDNAVTLRREMTKEERHLWYDCLKKMPVQWYRQKIIGNYIVDFYCPKSKLVVELDGSQHYETDGIVKDKTRDEYLISKGYTVLRYSNHDVNTAFDAVSAEIYNKVMGDK